MNAVIATDASKHRRVSCVGVHGLGKKQGLCLDAFKMKLLVSPAENPENFTMLPGLIDRQPLCRLTAEDSEWDKS